MEKINQINNLSESKNVSETRNHITIVPKTTLAIEVIGGMSGFMGFGWFLSNKKKRGLLFLLGYFFVRGISILLKENSIFFLTINFVPIIFSVIYLYFENRKTVFELVQIPKIMPVILEAIGSITGIVGFGWLFANKNKQGIAIICLYTLLKFIYKQYASNPTSIWFFIINASLCTISVFCLFLITNVFTEKESIL